MSPSCPFPSLVKYNKIFGEPGSRKGMRKYRFFGIAIFDTVIVIIFAYIFSLFNEYSFWINMLALFILGIIIHRMFCVRTTIDKFLFP